MLSLVSCKMSLEQMRALLEASQEIRRDTAAATSTSGWGRQCESMTTPKQGREAKGLLRAYVGKMTGLSRAQVTRLVA